MLTIHNYVTDDEAVSYRNVECLVMESQFLKHLTSKQKRGQTKAEERQMLPTP